MNNKVIPTISINPIYNTILNEKDKDAKEYVKEKMGKAMFLIKSIELRKSTLYKVLEEVLKVQRGFFEYGKKELKPMTLKQVADAIGMHESTVSRAIREKYILTSFGTIKIKDLFATGVHKGSFNAQDEDITVSKMKKEIEDIIKEENKSKPLSDQAIADILKENLIKYLEEQLLNIEKKWELAHQVKGKGFNGKKEKNETLFYFSPFYISFFTDFLYKIY